MAAGGVVMSLTAPLEVVFVREFWHTGLFIGIFMLSASIGVIVVDVFGTRLIPGLDARAALAVGLVLFGVACIGIGLATGGALLMASRVMQGIGGGLVFGAGLQAAVRVRPSADDVAQSVGRFNAAFLFGGAIGSPGGLFVAGLIDGRLGYQTAFVGTGVFALVVATALTAALPRLAAPPRISPPRIGLPRLDKTPGSRATLVLAMSGDFLRGGVLFTALPLAGAALGYSTMTISVAIALMSGVEIVALLIAYRYIRSDGMVATLIASFALGMVCAALLALVPSQSIYLLASALFGVSLAGATATLPVLIVAQVGESSTGLARFRISAGIGLLAGSVGCAVVGAEVGIAALFGLIAVVLLASAQLARVVGAPMAPM
ncbi:MFS transporter [Mycobacterium doricum]|uniref:Arabinose transporter permease n=2 Tax=Mycolicibacterium doricum TaxID=126673 RepID=A0A1X1THS1_9MYCO|nr:MFS transporter [Mycolicibacterium doricum]ORV44058.1 arabinose transporter permease [Mycolicibacterium doricum]